MASNVLDPQHYMRPGILQLEQLPPLSVYVHLPWCLKKCPYCDFNSHVHRAVDSDAQSLAPDLEQQYIAALLADLENMLPLIWGRRIVSVFFGGGTPSLFSPNAIEQLLHQLRARLPIAPDIEITLEANPGTFERDRFAAYAGAGINRLSIGVQSFNNAYLQALGRVHSAEQAQAAVAEAAQHFRRFNLDIMYALPQQSADDLRDDLQLALSYQPPHLSVYHLTLEENTLFHKHPPKGLPSDDMAYAMLDVITEAAQGGGLQRYEVSAYAQPKQQCVHNHNYWMFGDYLGIGAGAHSKISFAHRIVRQSRLRDPKLYMQHAGTPAAINQEHEVKRSELPFEFMLNALRLTDGFDKALFIERTGLPFSAVQHTLEQAAEKRLLHLTAGRVQPTQKGLDFLSDLQTMFL